MDFGVGSSSFLAALFASIHITGRMKWKCLYTRAIGYNSIRAARGIEVCELRSIYPRKLMDMAALLGII